MKLRALTLVSGLLAVNQIMLAGEPAVTKPGPNPPPRPETVLLLKLQNAPNSFEPVAEMTRPRVDNRTTVGVHITNLSPIDNCTPGNRSSTPTPQTNPLESLVTTISGLGGFSLALEHVNLLSTRMDTLEIENKPPEKKKPFSDDPRFTRFWDDSHGFHTGAATITTSQRKLLDGIDQAARTLATYPKKDYRGKLWRNFDPEGSSEIKPTRDLITNPLTTVDDAARQQAIVDEMSGFVTDLAKTTTTTPKLKPTPEEVAALSDMNEAIGQARGMMAIINNNNEALKNAQKDLKTAYVGLVKVHDDFNRRCPTCADPAQKPGEVYVENDVLAQDISLPTAHKTTDGGAVSCVSTVDYKTATTDSMTYSVLYQDSPRLSASAGMLTTFQRKQIVGTTQVAAQNSTGFNTEFAITDQARSQVFPMAFVNYRLGRYGKKMLGRTHEDEYAFSTHASAGFGINPNSGTNQPEFFAGMAIAVNRFMFHPGVHFGRTQTLGGGFALNTLVPATFSGTVPVNWGYHATFSIGFSVRVAPF
jgi:hypothetical protein